MQPSSKYESTEKTYAGGFVYKETNKTFSSIYALDDAIDMSVSYTTPINSNFNKVNMGGWNSTSAAAYVSKRQRFRKEWTTAGGGKAYSNVNGLAVSKSPFASSGNVTIVFSNGSGNKYYFGKSAQASATIGSFGQKLITDFEVNKVIFRITLLTGWTKAEFDYFKSNGSLQDTDGSNINVSDFIANPSNYIIRTFDVSPVGYWDGSTWKANNLSNSPNIHINFLIDTDKVSGICNIQKHHFDNASGTGSYGVYNISVYNSTSGNTTEIASLVRGSVVSQLQNVGSGTGGFVLDSVTDPLELDPDLTGDEMTNMCDSGIVGAGDTLPAHDVSMCSALTVLKYDQYTLSYDVGSSGQTHFSRYNYYFCTGMKGEYVDKLFAYAGVYFYNGSLTDLNDSGATPTNLKVTGMRLGEMNSDGQTTGNWINPNQMDDYVGPNKTGSIIHPNYNPTPVSPDGDDIDDHKMGAGSQLSGIAQLWLLTRAQLIELHEAFANAPANYDPMSSFISVMGLGISALRVVGDSMPWTLNPINIRMSNGETWHTGVEAHIVDSQVSAFNELNIRIQRKYNNFLDYSPYATHEIFLPMCGWVTLPDIAVDRGITVTYIPDIETLKIRAVVSVVDNSGNRCVIGEKDGVMGAEIPFTNIGHSLFLGNTIVQSADIAGEIVTGAIGAGFTKTNAKGGTFRPYEGFTVGMAGTLPGAIGNALVSGNINRTHFTTGNGSRVGFGDGENIQIKSTYHRIDKPNNYDHTVGKVCNKTGHLSDFTGFTVCENPHINFSATEREKEEIKQLLEQGVIL